MENHVIRYVATYVKGGQRRLMCAAQGRNTYETFQEAQQWIDAVMANNSADNISQVWGDNPQFAVRECRCWARHFDPVGIYFD